MTRIESMAPLGRAQITYMFLGEHTHAQAQSLTASFLEHTNTNQQPVKAHVSIVSPHSNNISSTSSSVSPSPNAASVNGNGGSFSLSYFYPVLPIEYIIPPPVTTTMTTGDGATGAGISSGSGVGGSSGVGGGSSSGGVIGVTSSTGTIVEAIVGNDVQEVLLVSREIDKSTPSGMSRWKGVGLRRQDVATLQQQQQSQSQQQSSSSSSEYRPLFVLQGNFGGKHAHRRDPKGATITPIHPCHVLPF